MDRSMIYRVVDTLGFPLTLREGGAQVVAEGLVDIKLGGLNLTVRPKVIAGRYDDAMPELNLFIDLVGSLSMLLLWPSAGLKEIILINRAAIKCKDADIRKAFVESLPEDLPNLFVNGAVASFMRQSTVAGNEFVWEEV